MVMGGLEAVASNKAESEMKPSAFAKRLVPKVEWEAKAKTTGACRGAAKKASSDAAVDGHGDVGDGNAATLTGITSPGGLEWGTNSAPAKAPLRKQGGTTKDTSFMTKRKFNKRKNSRSGFDSSGNDEPPNSVGSDDDLEPVAGPSYFYSANTEQALGPLADMCIRLSALSIATSIFRGGAGTVTLYNKFAITVSQATFDHNSSEITSTAIASNVRLHNEHTLGRSAEPRLTQSSRDATGDESDTDFIKAPAKKPGTVSRAHKKAPADDSESDLMSGSEEGNQEYDGPVVPPPLRSTTTCLPCRVQVPPTEAAPGQRR
ncbi:hypothetical protein HPB51_029147 [Rhipicephalus microplus]|uniref:Uncharacterized protein n=1 Tax=Rhipicephalus microplus TaxID=6941 RepID=A0A9J6CVD0_RHIMP|nr:hypothetical protein HPB51_029147 [Rhipicephalus microplus]